MPLQLVSDQLTDAEEAYCQMRARGLTKTAAATKAYPDTAYPKQMGYQAEVRERVINRIAELKEERAEVAGLDVGEQCRRYTEIYNNLMNEGKWTAAAAILTRLDAIGGFDAPTKNISLTGKLGEAVRDSNGNLDNDVKRFAGILQPHSKQLTSKDTSEVPIDVTFDVVVEATTEVKPTV